MQQLWALLKGITSMQFSLCNDVFLLLLMSFPPPQAYKLQAQAASLVGSQALQASTSFQIPSLRSFQTHRNHSGSLNYDQMILPPSKETLILCHSLGNSYSKGGGRGTTDMSVLSLVLWKLKTHSNSKEVSVPSWLMPDVVAINGLLGAMLANFHLNRRNADVTILELSGLGLEHRNTLCPSHLGLFFETQSHYIHICIYACTYIYKTSFLHLPSAQLGSDLGSPGDLLGVHTCTLVWQTGK